MIFNTVLLSIHGVETEGKWQEEIDGSFQGIAGLAHDRYKYGHFQFWKPLLASSRDAEILAFSKEWDRIFLKMHVVPSVIAHSFGSYIVSRALLRFPAISFDRVILCGSIVDCDFDWPALISNGRVNAVLNETAGKDWVVALFREPITRAAIEGGGPSGLDRFNRHHEHLVQRDNPEFEHSDAFVMRSHCDIFWRPFIFDNVVFAGKCLRAKTDPAARRELRRDFIEVIKTHLERLFGGGSDSPYEGPLADIVFDKLVDYGSEGIRSAKQLIFAIAVGLWQKSLEDEAAR